MRVFLLYDVPSLKTPRPRSRMFLVLFVACTVFFSTVQSFYHPDLAPVEYCTPETSAKHKCQTKIDVFVNRLSSTNSLLGFDYGRFDLCMPEHVQHPRENLGQVVFGDRISNSPYTALFQKSNKCAFVCKKEYQLNDTSALEKVQFLLDGIKNNYFHYWIIDNMPVTWCVDVDSLPGQSASSFGVHCSTGFPLGCHVTKDGQALDACRIYESLKKPGSVYLFNHVDIVITFNPGAHGRALLISAKATPRSIKHPEAGNVVDCWNPQLPPMDLGSPDSGQPLVIKYSYSIDFKERHDLKWSSRWDDILNSISDSSIHWLSIVNSLLVVVFLSMLIAVVLLQALRRDIARYNSTLPGDESFGRGWKSLCYDVFRPPKYKLLLSAMVGFGSQVTIVSLCTVGVACTGVLSPASRGALATFILVLFVCMSGVAGYVSALIYKMYGGNNRKVNVLASGIFFPGLVFGVLFLLNLILWIEGSSSAIPFTTLLALLIMWCCVSEPLVFLGAYFGFQRPAVEHPVRISSAEVELPRNLYSLFRCLGGGLLPFVVLFIPVFFILTSIWSNQIYYLYGFLLIVLILFAITSAQSAVLLCYFQLSAGDCHWCWTSFFSSGSVALYFFIYSSYYYWHSLHMVDLTSAVLYLGYIFTLTQLLFVAAGSIGWISCLFFIRKIYSSVKLE